MLFQEIKSIQSTQKTLRSFGMILSVFLVILGSVSLWKGGSTFPYFFAAAGLSLTMALAYPPLLKIIYLPWMAVATVIGFVLTRVILTVFYFVVMTPVAVGAKLFGKDLIDRKIEPEKSSYWAQRTSKLIIKEELERQF